jgi:hypothetical protein
MILRELGFAVPGPEVPKDASNPLGFGEPLWVVDYHERLMQQLALQMTDGRPTAFANVVDIQADSAVIAELNDFLKPFATSGRNLVVKDPRLLWFLSMWIDASSAAGFRIGTATMLRHPAEVLHSKVSWYGTTITDTHRVAGWINTMLGVERGTRDLARCFVRFDDLLSDWTQEVARLSQAFKLPELLAAPAQKQIRAASLVDGSLKRSVRTWNGYDVPKSLIVMAEGIWENLNALVEDPTGTAQLANLDRFRTEYDAMFSEAEALTTSVVHSAVQVERQSHLAEIQRLKMELQRANKGAPGGARYLPFHRRLVRKVPRSVRHLVPEEVRNKTLQAFDATKPGGAT